MYIPKPCSKFTYYQIHNSCTPYCICSSFLDVLLHTLILFMHIANSCILGDPRGEHIKIDGFTQRQVKGKEVLASNASSLALKLMDLFFTKEEMARSNCTPAEGREILRQDIIAGIQCKVESL